MKYCKVRQAKINREYKNRLQTSNLIVEIMDLTIKLHFTNFESIGKSLKSLTYLLNKLWNAHIIKVHADSLIFQGS